MKKKIIISFLVFISFFIILKEQAFAAEYGEACNNNTQCSTGVCRSSGFCGCAHSGHCFSGSFCNANNLCQAGSPTTSQIPTSSPGELGDAIGNIDAPPGVDLFNQQADGVGIILFFSNLIKLIAIIAGLWAMLNFILAGFTYVTSAGDPGKIEKIGSKLTLSVVGLGIIVASYTLAALIGLIFFGDATFIINPKIPSAIL